MNKCLEGMTSRVLGQRNVNELELNAEFWHEVANTPPRSWPMLKSGLWYWKVFRETSATPHGKCVVMSQLNVSMLNVLVKFAASSNWVFCVFQLCHRKRTSVRNNFLLSWIFRRISHDLFCEKLCFRSFNCIVKWHPFCLLSQLTVSEACTQCVVRKSYVFCSVP